MPPKSKVKFTESQKNLRNKEATPTTPSSPPGSDNAIQNSATATANAKRKSGKKTKSSDVSSEVLEDESNEDGSRQDIDVTVTSSTVTRVSEKSNDLVLSDPDKNVSDGSTSDVEVPYVKLRSGEDTEGVCPVGGAGCGIGVHLVESEKVSPCLKSDDQDLATTDYATSAAMTFLPKMIHPINGRVSTFTRHREFTDYLRNSGCLRLFGSCILAVYRMNSWPPAENLMEQLVNSMGYLIPSRKQVEELKNRKQALILKLKLLTKERCQLLERLDQFQDSKARYELLDQDEILPPRPDNSKLDIEAMTDTFKVMRFDEGWTKSEEEKSTELKVTLSKPKPVLDSLTISYHDKRILQ